MKTSVRALGVGLLVVCMGCASGATSGAPRPQTAATGGALERPTGPQTLRKGESHEVEIHQAQTHEWGIDLAAGEQVTFTIRATSTGAQMCQNWSWGFFNPAGGTLHEEPMIPTERGEWSSEMQQSAVSSAVEGPTAGRYVIRVTTDVTNCPQLHYTLRAR